MNIILSPLIHGLILRVSHLGSRRVALFKCLQDIKPYSSITKKHKALMPCALQKEVYF